MVLFLFSWAAISGPFEKLKADPKSIQEFVEMLATTDKAWNGVLQGSRAAVLFEGNTLNCIRINSGTIDMNIKMDN